MRFKTNHPWRMHTKNGSPKMKQPKKQQVKRLKKKNSKKHSAKPAIGSIDCIHRIQGKAVRHCAPFLAASTQKLLDRIFNVFFSVGSFIKNKRKKKPKFVRLFPDDVATFERFFFDFGSRFVFNEHQLICRSVWRHTNTENGVEREKLGTMQGGSGSRLQFQFGFGLLPCDLL